MHAVDFCGACCFLLVLVKTVKCSTLDKPILNTTTQMFSACLVPLGENDCPRDSHLKEFRELCINNFKGKCPSDMPYVCGKDKNGYRIEKCKKIHTCPAGQTNALRIDSKDWNTPEATIFCEQCDNMTFSPSPSNSSDGDGSLTGCPIKRYPGRIDSDLESKKLVLYEVGWPTLPDKFHCNHHNGWSSDDGKMTFTALHPFLCIGNVKCQKPEKPYLLPDGQCVEECRTERKASNGFMCEMETAAGNVSGNTSQIKDDSQPENEVNGEQVAAIVTCVVLCFVGLAGLIFCCYRYRHRINGTFCSEDVQVVQNITNHNHYNHNPVRINNNEYHATNMVNGRNATQNIHTAANSVFTGTSMSSTSSIGDDQEKQPMMEYLFNNEEMQDSICVDPTQPVTDAGNMEFKRDGFRPNGFRTDEDETKPKTVD